MASFFTLDTAGDQQLFSADGVQASSALYADISKTQLLDESEAEDDEQEATEVEFFGIKLNSKDVSKVLTASMQETRSQAPSKVSIQLDEVRETVKEAAEKASTHILQKRHRITNLDYEPGDHLNERKTNVAKDMLNAKDVEHVKALPTVGKRKQPIINRAEREKTKGSGWFDLPATEITDEMRNELKIIQMRSVLNPKHFYKKNDLKVLPKYFQIGTVQHSPLDHYHEKHTRKTKKTLVDELLEDEAFQKFNKRKYKEVIQRTDKYAHRKAMKKMKKLKKRK